jgi:prepilin-type N-terminal cleavage/methylation domain-containing protein
MLQGAKKRTAMTLVELLVVMAIIVIFTAITAAFYPANQADRELSRFSSTVQSALLSARNRAKAERLPTGIRFYADPNSPTKVGSVVLIQKPAPLDGLSFGGVGVTETPANSGVFLVTFATPLVSGTGDKILTGGDYIVLNTGETARFSGNVGTNQMQLDSLNTNTGFVSKLQTNPQGYKIFRGAIDLSGDTPFELSNIIEIQIPSTLRFPLPSSFTQASFFPPQPLAPAPANPPLYFEIIFNPDGSLNNSTSEVYLHLHNFEFLANDSSRDAILAVRKMSGSIGVYEVGPTGAPYQFAFDPRNKGI